MFQRNLHLPKHVQDCHLKGTQLYGSFFVFFFNDDYAMRFHRGTALAIAERAFYSIDEIGGLKLQSP